MAVDSILYANSLKKLLPKGSYWNKVLNNPTSDVSLVLMARAEEIARFTDRSQELKKESIMQTASETLDEWEKIYLGYTNQHFTKEKRRSILLSLKNYNLTTSLLKKLAKNYGVTIIRVLLPYQSCFFGHSSFVSFMGNPATLSVVFIYCELSEESIQANFEEAVKAVMLSNKIVYFFYN